jgi:hypothetical protein
MYIKHTEGSVSLWLKSSSKSSEHHHFQFSSHYLSPDSILGIRRQFCVPTLHTMGLLNTLSLTGPPEEAGKAWPAIAVGLFAAFGGVLFGYDHFQLRLQPP